VSGHYQLDQSKTEVAWFIVSTRRYGHVVSESPDPHIATFFKSRGFSTRLAWPLGSKLQRDNTVLGQADVTGRLARDYLTLMRKTE
jgi:hypothetical protein